MKILAILTFEVDILTTATLYTISITVELYATGVSFYATRFIQEAVHNVNSSYLFLKPLFQCLKLLDRLRMKFVLGGLQ